jgi:hypothetical protein
MPNEDSVCADVDFGKNSAFNIGGDVIDDGIAVRTFAVLDAIELIFVLCGKAPADIALMIRKYVDRKRLCGRYDRMAAARTIDHDEDGSRIRTHATDRRCRHPMTLAGMICRDDGDAGRDAAHDQSEHIATNQIRMAMVSQFQAPFFMRDATGKDEVWPKD